jgi:hypothetical protein
MPRVINTVRSDDMWDYFARRKHIRHTFGCDQWSAENGVASCNPHVRHVAVEMLVRGTCGHALGDVFLLAQGGRAR